MKPNSRVKVKANGRIATIVAIQPYNLTSMAFIRYCDHPFEADTQLVNDLVEYDHGVGSIC